MKSFNVFGGLDLSIYDKKTCICFIRKKSKFEIVFVKDRINEADILGYIKKFNPLYFSIDAPLTWRKIEDRREDKILRKYFNEREMKMPGILPFYVKSMRELSEKGRNLYFKLKKFTKIIETHPTASIRAMGFKEDYKRKRQDFKLLIEKIKDNFLNIDLIKNHNQLDSLFCALFSYYFYKGENILIVRKKLPYGIVIKF